MRANGARQAEPRTVDVATLTRASTWQADTRAIPRLPALTVLRLNHNLITSAGGEVPPDGRHKERGLAALAALEVLQLGYNQVTDVPSLRLHYLHNLKVCVCVHASCPQPAPSPAPPRPSPPGAHGHADGARATTAPRRSFLYPSHPFTA